ncbi:ThiF family adenylyltransferase [Gimesia sp.]|uniref:ThiF family adenylyltransferase n=1 Tax=Gimesia sp. TaxID=2024833 RepID=UPI003A936E56
MTNIAPDYRLIITHAAWSAALRSMLLDADRCAIGSLRWNNTVTSTEFLVHQLDLVERWPVGEERFPLTDWLVMAVSRDPSETPVKILQQIKPRKSQTVIILTFYDEDRQRWDGFVHREGEVIPLNEIHIIGPGMMRLNREDEPVIQELPTAGRWSRTIGALGGPLWSKVRNSNLLLIGCGRNGTLAAWNFAGLGIEQMTLVDEDVLKIENLDAMPGLTLDDIGLPKVTVLARHLIAYNNEMTIRCFTKPVHEILDQLRTRFDLIITCVDSDVARVAASWLSRELLIPHLDIGTEVGRTENSQLLAGDVRLLQPYDGGCVSCVGGLRAPAEAQYEFAAPHGSLHRGEPAPWYEQRVGSLIHLNSMTVGTSVELWLASLQGHTGSFWQRLTWNDKTGLEAEGVEVMQDEACPYCHVGN